MLCVAFFFFFHKICLLFCTLVTLWLIVSPTTISAKYYSNWMQWEKLLVVPKTNEHSPRVLQRSHSSQIRNGLANTLFGDVEDFLGPFNLKNPYNFRVSRTPSSTSSSFPMRRSINPHPLPSPSVFNVVITDLIARLGEFRFTIINSPIFAGLKLAPFSNIS